ESAARMGVLDHDRRRVLCGLEQLRREPADGIRQLSVILLAHERVRERAGESCRMLRVGRSGRRLRMRGLGRALCGGGALYDGGAWSHGGPLLSGMSGTERGHSLSVVRDPARVLSKRSLKSSVASGRATSTITGK